MTALPYYCSSASAYKMRNYWVATLYSTVGPDSKMPPLKVVVRVWSKSTQTEQHAINWALHRAVDRLRAYYHGTVLIPRVRALHLDPEAAKTYNLELKARYGDDWTYKSLVAQAECAAHFGLEVPSAMENFQPH